MKRLLLFLALFAPPVMAQSLALDVFNGTTFEQVEVNLGANSLLGFDANGDPARITAGTGITISGNVITSSGSGSSTLAALTDVTLTSPANNQLLRYNSASSKWVNWTPDFLVSSDLSGYLTSAAAASAYASLTGSYANPSWITSLAWSKISSTPTTLAGYGITDSITASAVASGYAPLAHNQDWSTITDTPTTLAGYGIADAQATLVALTEDVMNGTTRISHITNFATATGPGLITFEEAPEQEADFLGIRAPNSLTSTITYVLPQAPTTSGHVLTTGAAAGGEAVTAWQAVVAPAGTLTGNTLAAGITASSLTSLGTIATGVWQGTSVGIAYGGTGATTAANARIALLPSMTGNGGKFLRVNAGATDYELANVSGGGDALTSGTLAQFAATTSTQLRGVLSDESGTGEFLTTNGSAASLTSFPTLNQSTTGNAATATALQTGRAINGVTFDGTSAITVTAAAGTLTGNTLAAGVTASSLTSAAGGSFGTAAFTAATAYEVPLTFSTGLTRSTNTITVNTSQNIATLSNLTSNGFVKTSGGTGALSIDTSTYLTTTGNGSSLTGLTQSQISGLTTTDRAQFANVRPTHSTLTYAATTDIDMDGNGFQTLTLTGNVTFTTSNRDAGRSKTIRIVGDSSLRTFTFPAGWTWIGAAAPASIAASKDAILTITAFGTADSDIIAAYAVEP